MDAIATSQAIRWAGDSIHIILKRLESDYGVNIDEIRISKVGGKVTDVCIITPKTSKTPHEQ